MSCAICDRELTTRSYACTLNGRRVCRTCQLTFATRRYIAFVIDFSILFLLPMYLLSLAYAARATSQNDGPEWLWSILDSVPRAALYLFCFLIFAAKDGFSGYSPGKRLLGLRVMRTTDRTPIGPVESLHRNALLIVPLVWPFLPFQLLTGSRGGDDAAKTRVIWERRAHATPFFPSEYRCRGCGYALRGLVGRCPECGRQA